jgi:hypothetical protein
MSGNPKIPVQHLPCPVNALIEQLRSGSGPVIEKPEGMTHREFADTLNSCGSLLGLGYSVRDIQTFQASWNSTSSGSASVNPYNVLMQTILAEVALSTTTTRAEAPSNPTPAPGPVLASGYRYRSYSGTSATSRESHGSQSSHSSRGSRHGHHHRRGGTRPLFSDSDRSHPGSSPPSYSDTRSSTKDTKEAIADAIGYLTAFSNAPF